MSPMEQEMKEHDRGNEHDGVEIRVNRQPVHMAAREATGLQIKEAAIAQQVEIQLDFVLSGKVHGKLEVIGDQQRVELHHDEEFSAVAPDDNS
jgi:hypothetical protein